jgi:hypothetical protein
VDNIPGYRNLILSLIGLSSFSFTPSADLTFVQFDNVRRLGDTSFVCVECGVSPCTLELRVGVGAQPSGARVRFFTYCFAAGYAAVLAMVAVSRGFTISRARPRPDEKCGCRPGALNQTENLTDQVAAPGHTTSRRTENGGKPDGFLTETTDEYRARLVR